MVNVIIDNYVRVTGLPKDLFDEVTSRLTYANPDFVKAQKYSNSSKVRFIPRIIVSYEYENHQLCLPKGFYFEFINLLAQRGIKYNLTDLRNKKTVSALEQKGKPRSYQEKMIFEASAYPGPSFLIQAPPGTGKTFTGLEFARRLSRKTLWVCHTGPLLKQAIESAEWVLGQPKKDIGIIGQGKFKVGKFLTVALVQSLHRKKDKVSKLKYEFGTVIVDEVHHSPAKTWNSTIHMFAPEQTIGLTATAYRTDGLTELMFDCIGPVVTKADPELLIKEKVLIVPRVYQMYTHINYPGIVYTQIIKDLVEDNQRTNRIVNLIKYIHEKEDSVTMVLSHRVAHVNNIYDLCVKEGLDPIKLLGTQMTKTEKTIAYERLSTHSSRLIIATYKLLSEGFDHPPINHMILSTPFKDSILFEQVVGRSQRTYKDKDYSVIVDIVDNNNVLIKQANTRKAIAEGLGMQVQHFNASVLDNAYE